MSGDYFSILICDHRKLEGNFKRGVVNVFANGLPLGVIEDKGKESCEFIPHLNFKVNNPLKTERDLECYLRTIAGWLHEPRACEKCGELRDSRGLCLACRQKSEEKVTCVCLACSHEFEVEDKWQKERDNGGSYLLHCPRCYSTEIKEMPENV